MNRLGNVCLRASGFCFALRESIDPFQADDAALTQEAADRILSQVMARIAGESILAFQPTASDCQIATYALQIQQPVYVAPIFGGVLIATHKQPLGRA